MALTDLRLFYLHAGISNSTNAEDSQYRQWIAEAEAGVKTFLRGRNLARTTYTNEYYDGPGRQTLILRQRPVTSVSDVRVDQNGRSGQASGAFSSNSVWTAGTDYFVRRQTEDEANPGELIAVRFGLWPRGIGNIRVTYVAGYQNQNMPKDVQLAVHLLVSRIAEDAEHGRPVMSERLGSYSYTLLAGKNEGSEMASAAAMLMRYRNII